MNKLNPAIQATKLATGAYSVSYTILDTNVKYIQENVTITQSTDECLLGVKVQIELVEITGSSKKFQGEFDISTEYDFNTNNPFLDIGIYVNEGGVLERKGGGILRHEDSDEG